MTDENFFFTDAKTHDIKKDLEFGRVLGRFVFK